MFFFVKSQEVKNKTMFSFVKKERGLKRELWVGLEIELRKSWERAKRELRKSWEKAERGLREGWERAERGLREGWEWAERESWERKLRDKAERESWESLGESSREREPQQLSLKQLYTVSTEGRSSQLLWFSSLLIWNKNISLIIIVQL